MALLVPYAMPEQLEARLGTPDDGTYYERLLSASRAVESFTRRQFNRVEDASPRRFRALDGERVAVDDFWDLEDLEVEVAGVAWDVETQIDARPWDGVKNGQVNWPYSDLFAVGRTWPWSRRALITVTAKWGWESVPPGIIEATLDAAEVMSQGVGKSGLVRSETIAGYSISYAFPERSTHTAIDVPPELVKAVPYRRKIFGIA